MHYILFVVVLFCALMTSGVRGAEDAAAITPVPSHSNNPLRDEMIARDAMLRGIVSAAILADGARVRRAIDPLRGAGERTEAALRAGNATCPWNARRIKAFIKRDRRLHDHVLALDSSARRGHSQEMLRITKQIVDECAQCHRAFSKSGGTGIR